LDPEFQADLSYRTFAPGRYLVPVKHFNVTGERHIVPGASLPPPSADFWPQLPTWGQYQAIAAVLASFEPTWKARGWSFSIEAARPRHEQLSLAVKKKPHRPGEQLGELTGPRKKGKEKEKDLRNASLKKHLKGKNLGNKQSCIISINKFSLMIFNCRLTSNSNKKSTLFVSFFTTSIITFSSFDCSFCI
jgi:hypothetical protein